MSEKRSALADEIIKKYSTYSTYGAFVPIPLLDVIVITFVQMYMLAELTELYGLDWSKDIKKQFFTLVVVVTAGSSFFASGAKIFHLIGIIIGTIVQVICAGPGCYALGKAFKAKLDSEGDNFDLEMFKSFLKSL